MVPVFGRLAKAIVVAIICKKGNLSAISLNLPLEKRSAKILLHVRIPINSIEILFRAATISNSRSSFMAVPLSVSFRSPVAITSLSQ